MTYSVPPNHGRESSCVTPRVAPRRDVVERPRSRRVQQRVEEPERRLSRVEPLVVEQCHDTRERWARRACARHRLERARDVHREAQALRGDVGVRASRRVEQARVCGPERAQVCLYRRALVTGLQEDVGEAACRELGGRLGAVPLGAPYRCEAV